MTTPRFRRGLVVGKFSPLHLGHELLIGRAEAACDAVVVLGYSQPELAPSTRANRERWLLARHPRVRAVVLDDAHLAGLCAQRGLPPRTLPHNDADADADTHRAFVGWLLIDFLGIDVDAAFTSEHDGDGFAASLTRQFRARRPGHAGVGHVLVDIDRSAVAVSGTDVRANAAAHRHLVATEVFADLVPRDALLGAESSGKTTPAKALAARLGTTWIGEYGRERWEEVGGILSVEELVRIGRVQVEREIEGAQTARGWLVCDTSPLTTLVYCLLDHGDAPPELRALAGRRYDRVVVCAPDFAFVQDGTRRDADFQQRQHALTTALLAATGTPRLDAIGTLEARLDRVVADGTPLIGAPPSA